MLERAASLAHNSLHMAKRTSNGPELDLFALACTCALRGERERARHHAVQAARHIAPADASRGQVVPALELLVALARFHAAGGDGDSVERCACRARALARQAFGEPSAELADVCTALLPSCTPTRPSLAVELAAAALLSRLRTLGLRHTTTAAAHRNLGLTLLVAGDATGAAREYEEALAIDRQLYGDGDRRVGEALDLLAHVRRQMSHGHGDDAGPE